MTAYEHFRPRGRALSSGGTAEIRPGCALPITNIPLGTTIHNVEMKIGNRVAHILHCHLGKIRLASDLGKFRQHL